MEKRFMRGGLVGVVTALLEGSSTSLAVERGFVRGRGRLSRRFRGATIMVTSGTVLKRMECPVDAQQRVADLRAEVLEGWRLRDVDEVGVVDGARREGPE
jgi:hypothetical protein